MDTETMKRDMDTIVRENLARIREGIAEAEYKYGRAPGSVTLVGITKFKTAEEILPALQAGLADVGENRAQEFTDKLGLFD